jgi:hypothetical protein
MQHNLDEIFDRFYPRSQTVEQGIFLKRAAWTVEIILAIIGCLIGILMMIKFQKNPDEIVTTSGLIGFTADSLMMGLIFFMVGIIELTKIPLASAVYYSQTFWIRSIFLIALIAVNISTFETVVAGFERINNQRTEDFRKLLIKKDTLEDQILEKRIKIDEKNLNKQIDDLQKKYTLISSEAEKIENLSTKKKLEIETNSNQSGVIETLTNQIKRDENNRENLQNNNLELSKQIKESGVFKNRAANQLIQDQIDNNNTEIISLSNRIDSNTNKLVSARQKAQIDNKSQLDQIDNQTNRQLKPLRDNLNKIQKLIDNYTDDLNNIAERNRENLEEITSIQDEIDGLVKKIDEEGPKNQVIRVASWFKNIFIIDYEKENLKKEREINELETSKVFNTFLFWRFSVERTSKELEIIDNQISILNDQIIINDKKIELAKAKGSTKSVYSDIPEASLTFAFWIWFGVLSFIVSITGTMLAFASLNLRDPRMHRDRNENKLKRIGLFWWFVRLLSRRAKYIKQKTKLLFKPNIVEKKVEIEVEKVVEKIVEKPIIQEKIIEKEIEVPKQIEKKVFVHVPFPTDDPEVIKKGPMIYNDKDIDKGKK